VWEGRSPWLALSARLSSGRGYKELAPCDPLGPLGDILDVVSGAMGKDIRGYIETAPTDPLPSG